MAIFVFSADYSKTLFTVWEKIFWFISENGMINRLWSYCQWDIRVQISKKLQGHQKYTKTLYSKVNILLIVAFSERAK